MTTKRWLFGKCSHCGRSQVSRSQVWVKITRSLVTGMARHKGVAMAAMFDAITDWGNLWQAHRLAARGKRRRASAAEFEHPLADQLIALQDELRSRTYRSGAYCHFFIREPKLRRIRAAPFRDRVGPPRAVPAHRTAVRDLLHRSQRRQPHGQRYQAGRITFGELDASVQGWINHVRYADTWGLREHVFASHPIRVPAG